MLDIKDKTIFKHQYQIRVRTWEVDIQGIVHNSYYLRYMEVGRLEYKRSFGYDISPNRSSSDGLKVFVVHNAVDYLSTAIFDDVLNIYSRISWIKKSSFCFEHIIEKDYDKSIVATGIGVIVNVDNSTDKPVMLPTKFVNEIIEFETDCKLLR